MKIGIIGAGNIGSVLAGHFHKLHHTVFIANSRGPETLSGVAKETGANPVPITEVANGVDLLVITIPLKSIPLLPRNLLFNLDTSSPIIDTGNYYPLRDGVISEIKRGSSKVSGLLASWGDLSSKRLTTLLRTVFFTRVIRRDRRKGLLFRYQETMLGQSNL